LHLWYLLVLFVYSILFYPLFRWLVGWGKAILNMLGAFLALPGAIYLLGLPIAYLTIVLDPRTDLGQRNFGGWALPTYMLFFIYGFIVVSHDGLQKRIQQLRWISLVAAMAGIAALFVLWGSQGDPRFGSDRWTQVFGIFGISSWCWILAFFGFGFKHFTQSKPILTYANEAVLPFYILHQTILLCVGYFVLQAPLTYPINWLIIAAISFAIIMLVHEYLIRRFNVMRFLFGMKPLAKAETVLAQTAK
jgi:glucan biosynthesis protein C